MSKKITESNNNDYDIMLSELLLSTITVEAKLKNVKFKEYILIHKILQLIQKNDNNPSNNIYNYNTTDDINKIQVSEEIENELMLSDDIIKIGCNYGEYISNKYIELTTLVKKSNRGRKKKEKKVTNRKVQGNGKYFNSQISFTVLDKVNKKKFYHVKLFTNGTIQIPCVCNEDIESIRYLIQYIIDIISNFSLVKSEESEIIDIIYIKSIMRNYKFCVENLSLFIDLKKFQKVILNFKTYIDYKTIEDGAEAYISEIDTNLYDKYYDELTALTLTLVKHSTERYVGFLIKFKTPIELNEDKTSTVKIFASGKFNLDGCNTREQALVITRILYLLMLISKDYIFYFKHT
jgi:hypothetical protein